MNDEKANIKITQVEEKMILAYWEKYGKENSYNHYANGNFSTAGRSSWNSNISHEEDNRILSGQDHPMYGHKHTEEAKQKIGAANKGNKAWLGRTHTEETKQHLSEKCKNRKLDKWVTPNGEIKEMAKCHVMNHHKDWKLLK